MDWTWAIIMILIGFLLLVLFQLFSMGNAKSRKTATWLGVGVLVIGFVAQMGWIAGLAFLNQPIGTGQALVINQGGGGTGGGVVQTYQPTASYLTQDSFSATTSVPGTGYYKSPGGTTTTAITNTNAGTTYTYWVSNSTYYVEPKEFIGGGTQTIINDKAYSNGSMSTSGYDIVSDKAITSSASAGTGYNISMGANDNAKVKITVVGSAKTSNLPLGGVMVVEVNSSISTVSCSGDGILGLNSKYALTYTPSSINTKAIVYEVAKGFDVSKDGGMTGVTNVIRCDFTNGGTAVGTGLLAPWYVKFIPANYYVGNDGNFYLDVEKKANADTTRTGLGGSSTTFYWDS